MSTIATNIIAKIIMEMSWYYQESEKLPILNLITVINKLTLWVAMKSLLPTWAITSLLSKSAVKEV